MIVIKVDTCEPASVAGIHWKYGMASPFCTTLVILAKQYKWLFRLIRRLRTVSPISGILEWYNYRHLIEPVGDSVAVTPAYAVRREIGSHQREQLFVVTLRQKFRSWIDRIAVLHHFQRLDAYIIYGKHRNPYQREKRRIIRPRDIGNLSCIAEAHPKSFSGRVRNGNVQITEHILKGLHKGCFAIPAAAAQNRREFGGIIREPCRHAVDLSGQRIGHGKGTPPVCDLRLNGSQQDVARLCDAHRQSKTHLRSLPVKQPGRQLRDVYRCPLACLFHGCSFFVFSASYKGGFCNPSPPSYRILSF